LIGVACEVKASLLVDRLRKGQAALAQLVEHIIRNDGVNGSSPLSGTIATKGHAGVHGPFWQSTHTN
jgi:hypothetical protein